MKQTGSCTKRKCIPMCRCFALFLVPFPVVEQRKNCDVSQHVLTSTRPSVCMYVNRPYSVAQYIKVYCNGGQSL